MSSCSMVFFIKGVESFEGSKIELLLTLLKNVGLMKKTLLELEIVLVPRSNPVSAKIPLLWVIVSFWIDHQLCINSGSENLVVKSECSQPFLTKMGILTPWLFSPYHNQNEDLTGFCFCLLHSNYIMKICYIIYGWGIFWWFAYNISPWKWVKYEVMENMFPR